MNIISGSQYRNFAAQNEFNFVFSAANSTTSGISNLGFSGATGESLNIFKFESGKIFDLNNRYVWGYNPREIIDISGNIGSGYINYFINNTPVCLYAPRGTGYYDNFYINTQNSTVDFDFIINGTLPNYSFEYDANLEVLETITGYIKNTSSPIERSFKIFSGQVFNTNFEYSLLSFNSELISGGSSGQFLLKPVNVSANDVTPGNLTLLFYTNFGAITQDISFNVYPSPIYFTDFVTGYTGLLGLADDFTLEKLYNFELDSIYPTNRNVSFILQNISGHTGQKIYKDFNASGTVSGSISGFIYGFDYLTGKVNGTGIAVDEQDYFGNYPTGQFSSSLSISQIATGDVTYKYNLPITGGYGTGRSPSGTILLSSGYLTGIQTFSGFVYGQQNLYNEKNISITGYYGPNLNINVQTGLSMIYLPVYFTGSGSVDYSNFLWSSQFVTGSGSFSGDIISGSSNSIIGITGSNLFLITGNNSFNSGITSNQLSGEALIAIDLIPGIDGEGLGDGYLLNSSVSNADAAILGYSYAYFPNGNGSLIFSFRDYSSNMKGPIKYFSFELDKNTLYRPSGVGLELSTGLWPNTNFDADKLSNTLSLSTGSLYNSNTYYIKCTNPNQTLNLNNNYKSIRIFCSGNNKWENQSTGNLSLLRSIGLKNFRIYRSVPVALFNNSYYSPKALINSTGMTSNYIGEGGYQDLGGYLYGDIENVGLYNAFNSDKVNYPYAVVSRDIGSPTTTPYIEYQVGIFGGISSIFSGFDVEFEPSFKPSGFNISCASQDQNYTIVYSKNSAIQNKESGFFNAGTGKKYFRMNLSGQVVQIKTLNFYYADDIRMNKSFQSISGYGYIRVTGDFAQQGQLLYGYIDRPTGYVPAIAYQTGVLTGFIEPNLGNTSYTWSNTLISGTGSVGNVYLDQITGYKQAKNIINFNTGRLTDGDTVNIDNIDFFYRTTENLAGSIYNFDSLDRLANILTSGATGGLEGGFLLQYYVGITGYAQGSSLYLFSYLSQGEDGNSIKVYRTAQNIDSINIPYRYFQSGETLRVPTNRWSGNFSKTFPSLTQEGSGIYFYDYGDTAFYGNISGIAWVDTFSGNYYITTGLYNTLYPLSLSGSLVPFINSQNIYSGSAIITSGQTSISTGFSISILKPNYYNISGNIGKYIVSGENFIYSGLIEG